ncbi:hypothetical protein DSM110093_02653 [Sulfitobacter sp. DSM 110093]|uniref:hypothetical protein n=1 Tax=Sulfitobacter sp. DSM 110093 TaxID=2883127 RepID=UPI001FACA3A5|nr:hypothetical protein [Sulfitobacter sp. DSM 110093]UOA32846.1 hypothetical protein DSM110093_02653 [Sulfitobacter sp. DSM 110093]
MSHNLNDTNTLTDHAKAVADYLASDHWNGFLKDLEGDVWHSHIYADTCIHPDSLNTVIEAYFAKRGQPLLRRIDYLTPSATSKVAALHNLHPDGLPHFDLFFRFKAGCALAPMAPERAQDGRNILHWGKAVLDDFHQQFPFKIVGVKEEEEIRRYFKSRHWKDTLNMIMDPDIIHLHCNLVINFDPKILELLAREALAAQGWTIDKVVPNIFNVHGTYKGKLVFLGTHPERVYDIGWEFAPDTLIAPADKPWSRNDVPIGFDLCFTSEFDRLIASQDFVTLSDEEIQSIIRTFG